MKRTIGLILAQPPGYSETFFNTKIKGLQENGHEVTLFTGPSKETYQLCTHKKMPRIHKYVFVQVFSMFMVGLQLLPHLKAVRKFIILEQQEGRTLKRALEKVYLNAELLKFRGDWLHYGFATLALERELVAKAIGAKMAVSFRGYDINVYPLKHIRCYDLLWQQVDRVHTISRYLLNKAYKLGLDSNKSFQIIHPAVNIKNLPKHKELKAPSTKFKIVTIARFGWIKGLELLTEVALLLKNKGLDFEWTLIGTGNTAEIERYLFDVDEKKIECQLQNIGQTSHDATLKILSESDVYVQTSLNEGFCNALLEAQAIGVPCVAFKVGGIPENVADKKTGWLIEPYDVEIMAKTIIDVSKFSFKEKEAMAERAIKRVQDDFNLEEQKQAFHEFYRN